MDGTTPETCDECGFDAGAWEVADASTLLGGLGLWWRLATAGVDAGALNARPAPGVWSVLEYGMHTAFVTAVLREGLAMILEADGLALPDPPSADGARADDTAPVLDAAAIVGDVDREGRALAALARGAPADGWAHTGRLRGETLHATAVLRHAAHDASHHMMDAGRGLATLGAGTPRQQGTVVQVSASAGGVPKHEVPGAAVGHAGLAGDRQADRRHHGRPFQALCLWSAEVIGELASAGHPIAPGAAGENLTVAGVDWSSLRPGARLRVGTALAEVSFSAVPCAKQARWFTDGDFRRIDHDRNPHWTRWYAWVREPGEVSRSDTVVVQP